MPLSTAKLSFNEIRNEFGITGKVSLSDLYRGGSIIPEKAADNVAVEGSVNIPKDHAISLKDFQGSSAGYTYECLDDQVNVSGTSIFGDDWDAAIPKTLIVPSDVEIGSFDPEVAALDINAGGLGDISVVVNGTVSGSAANGFGIDGGDAVVLATGCNFTLTGTARSGGGTGGEPGYGGAGGHGGFVLKDERAYGEWTASADEVRFTLASDGSGVSLTFPNTMFTFSTISFAKSSEGVDVTTSDYTKLQVRRTDSVEVDGVGAVYYRAEQRVVSGQFHEYASSAPGMRATVPVSAFTSQGYETQLSAGTYVNQRPFNAAATPGSDPQEGRGGDSGHPGLAGTSGEWGESGTDGTAGTAGQNGTPGTSTASDEIFDMGGMTLEGEEGGPGGTGGLSGKSLRITTTVTKSITEGTLIGPKEETT